MHFIEWVTKTVNRDGKNLRHLKREKINLFQSFWYFWAFNLVFICPTLCHLKTTCLLLMIQKLYALDAFFIEKLKLSENDPLHYISGAHASTSVIPATTTTAPNKIKGIHNIFRIYFYDTKKNVSQQTFSINSGS